MAILKAVNPKKYKAKGIPNIVNYVLRKHKSSIAGEDKLIFSGINVEPTQAAVQMQQTKEFWGKTSGREYYHFIQSFPPDEEITIKQAHEVTRKFVEMCPEFKDYEVLVATHHDKDNHIDSHIIVNSVSFNTGYKFHYTRGKLAEWKKKQNELNISLGLKAAPKKGFTHDGKKREQTVANNRNLWAVLQKAENKQCESYIQNIAYSVFKNVKDSCGKEEFIQNMKKDGYTVNWKNKNVTFIDDKRLAAGEQKNRVRLSRLFDYYNVDLFNKEMLENELRTNIPRGEETDTRAEDLKRQLGSITGNERPVDGTDSTMSESGNYSDSDFKQWQRENVGSRQKGTEGISVQDNFRNAGEEQGGASERSGQNGRSWNESERGPGNEEQNIDGRIGTDIPKKRRRTSRQSGVSY